MSLKTCLQQIFVMRMVMEKGTGPARTGFKNLS